MAQAEDAMAATITTPTTATTTAESEGATTDEDMHLSPTCVCGGGGGGGGGDVGGRIKILCSFGGRIVPRPSDGVLKYVGGETRVLAVPRSIPFREMKRKVEMFKTEVAAIKYQLLSLTEDLDVLVSVTCDEDLLHMLDEYDRFEAKRSPAASPRFRVYIFAPQHAAPLPSAAAAAVPSSSRFAGYSRHHPQHHNHHHDHHFQPERYIATVPPNGSPPYSGQAHGAVSAGNSPRAANAVGFEQQPVFGMGMQRVRSSPNLGALDAAPQHFHPHAADLGGGGLAGGYMSSSPRHAGASPLSLQSSFHHYQHQYPPAPVPVPHQAGRYDARGYVRVGNYIAPMVPAAVRSADRPVSRGGPPLHGEMQTPALVWD
uniref:PB1 domain-containing protein n=1 Tax=Arundo donax TaxID=35708 RepID=A0A0A9DEP3_ARUDO